MSLANTAAGTRENKLYSHGNCMNLRDHINSKYRSWSYREQTKRVEHGSQETINEK